MYAIKAPSFFKPVGRPFTPAQTPVPMGKPDSIPSLERPRPLSKLSFSTFIRSPPTPAATPSQFAPLVQDGSYLEVLSLKLSEAVAKALAQPPGPAAAHEVLAGRRQIPAGRGLALGSLIASEINASRDIPHLQRAIIRCLQRPLSVLLSNISAHLLPLLAAPAFSVITLTPQAPNLNTTQIHAVALATLAGEVIDVFDELSLGLDHDTRPDGLRVIREGLVSVVSRVINPLMSRMQNEIVPLITQLQFPNTLRRTGSGQGLKNQKMVTSHHPSLEPLQAAVLLFAKALPKIAATHTAQSSLATMLISLVWHGVLALSHRSVPQSTPPSPTPTMVGVKIRDRIPSTPTPPTSSPPSRFAVILPPSRPSTPSCRSAWFAEATDARALYDILRLLPRPATKLACEAVDEAFENLAAFVTLLEAVHDKNSVTTANMEYLEASLVSITTNLPTLIALPVLLQAYMCEHCESRSVASMLGMSEVEYRKNCLAGFNCADEYEDVIGQHVIRVLRAQSSLGAIMISKWLEQQIRETT